MRSAGVAFPRDRVAAAGKRVRAVLSEDGGAAAAEFAVSLPAIVLVLAMSIGMLQAQAARVLLQDAAADAARLVARGDAPERAEALVAAAVSDGQLVIVREGGLVCAETSAPWRVVAEVAVVVRARACALGDGQ